MEQPIKDIISETLEVISEVESQDVAATVERNINSDRSPIDQLEDVVIASMDHVDDEELVEQIERTHEIVKLNLAYNQAAE